MKAAVRKKKEARAERSMAHVQRLALVQARPYDGPPAYFTDEEKSAWYIVKDAQDRQRKKEIWASLMAWAYLQEELKAP